MTTVILRGVWRVALGASVYLLVAGSFAPAQEPSFEGLNWEVETEFYTLSFATWSPRLSPDGSAIIGYCEAPGEPGLAEGGVFQWPTGQRWTTYAEMSYILIAASEDCSTVVITDPGFQSLVAKRINGPSEVLGQSWHGGGGGVSWDATAVSADGSVVLGSQTNYLSGEPGEPPQESTSGHVWRQGGQSWGIPGAALGVSADGSVVIGHLRQTSPATYEAFRWTPPGGRVGLGFLPGASSSSAGLISDDGSVIAGYSGDDIFRWTERDGMVDLGTGRYRGMSNDGLVIVGYSDDRMFRWTERDGMVDLGTGSYTAMSNDGSVILGSDGLWTEGDGWQSIGGGTRLSGDGTTVTDGTRLWTSTGGWREIADILTDDAGIDLTGWNLTKITGLSDNGLVVVGNGVNPDGVQEAWRAALPIPEPSTFALLLSSLAALAVVAARRRGGRGTAGRC